MEQQGEKLPPGLLKTSVELIAIQCPRERMEQIVQKEAQLTYIQFETAYKILYSMARLAPALGLAGTIVTLIRVFGHLTDPQSLVGYMAIALFSTLYGVVLANLCFVPLANKLRDFMDHEEIQKELIQEGILDIYDEENPRAIQFKLEALSAAAMRPAPAWTRDQICRAAFQKTSFVGGVMKELWISGSNARGSPGAAPPEAEGAPIPTSARKLSPPERGNDIWLLTLSDLLLLLTVFFVLLFGLTLQQKSLRSDYPIPQAEAAVDPEEIRQEKQTSSPEREETGGILASLERDLRSTLEEKDRRRQITIARRADQSLLDFSGNDRLRSGSGPA